jgi:hypothetical protein
MGRGRTTVYILPRCVFCCQDLEGYLAAACSIITSA